MPHTKPVARHHIISTLSIFISRIGTVTVKVLATSQLSPSLGWIRYDGKTLKNQGF